MSPGWEEQSEIVLSPPPLTRSPLSSCSLAPVNPTSLPLGQPCVSLLLLPAPCCTYIMIISRGCVGEAGTNTLLYHHPNAKYTTPLYTTVLLPP